MDKINIYLSMTSRGKCFAAFCTLQAGPVPIFPDGSYFFSCMRSAQKTQNKEFVNEFAVCWVNILSTPINSCVHFHLV